MISDLGIEAPPELRTTATKAPRRTKPKPLPPPRTKRTRACTLDTRPRTKRTRMDTHEHQFTTPIDEEQSADVESGLPDWVLNAFAAEVGQSDTIVKWNSKRHHQHLTVSDSGRSVATTGCAGYGAALSESVVLTSGGSLLWEVEAKSFGVGGFAVGVAQDQWKGPYKSLGRSASTAADAFVLGGAYHSSGNLLTSQASTVNKKEDSNCALWAAPFGPGAKLSVQLEHLINEAKSKQSSTLQVTFLLDGELAGSVVVPGTIGNRFALAVQPYMGGVAQLLRVPSIVKS